MIEIIIFNLLIEHSNSKLLVFSILMIHRKIVLNNFSLYAIQSFRQRSFGLKISFIFEIC